MKKIFTFFATALMCGQLFAGGIVTNSNQSAAYVRMMSRNASFGLDATYYNPAGIARLSNGFHFGLNNQSIFQTKTVTTTFPLNNTEFIGDVKAPLFPSFFAAYKMDKLGISFGFGPNGGGGSATYEKGLPSFEMMVAGLPTQMASAGIPADTYSADIYFDGSSVYWGGQLNFTYEVNEQFSVAAGVRMISAKNTYNGYIKNIMVNPNLSSHPLGGYLPQYTGSLVSAPTFFTDMATVLSGIATTAYGGGVALDPLVTGGAGDLTFAQAEAGIPTFDATSRAQLEGGLLAFGISQDQIDAMTLTQAQATYNSIGDQYTQNANDATENAAATGDIEVDATQTGMAFTPIFSAMYSPNDKLDIAIKYEMNTGLELTNDTKVDGSGMFKHDSTFRADIPAILGVGVGYKISDKFRTQFSFTTYFDKQADWGGKEDDVDKNLWEAAIGFEYDLSEKLTGSLGYSRGTTGVGENYQTDISYSNSSNTIGLGVQFRPIENLAIDLGALMVVYEDYNVDYPVGVTPTVFSNTYAKKTSMVAIGISYNF